ncbi:MAG TPA: hypothetical protein VFA89_04020 [Terriglobales bacterium]|nr:hypothetical protein [Terriglobales bacterium]
MRYWKGSISLSPTRDYALLRQVLHSGFITHNQLFEFLSLDYSASSRNAFNNRVRRLLKHGLLTRREMPIINREVVYSVSHAGVSELLGRGEHYVQPVGKERSNPAQSGLRHSVELNEIHLALKRSGTLVCWMPETEIRSRNDLTASGYWKYYDAIVTVRLAGQDCRFALEYERTPKAARHYRAIRERIEEEALIAHFLYLVPNHDLLWFVADRMAGCKRAIYFGLFRDFLQQTLRLPVKRSGSPASVSLDSILTLRRVAHRTGVLFPDIAV